jgi:acetyl esterase/lipase
MKKSALILLCCCRFSYAQQVTFKQLDSMPLQNMLYKQTIDTTLHIFYQLPKNMQPYKKYTAIVFIHGGAWAGGTAATLFPYANYFALRGMVGFSIEYRLINKETSSIYNCIADCKSAIRFIKQHAEALQVDTNNIIISGESAGGHLAACMFLLDGYNDKNDDVSISVKPKALVLYNPVVNLATPIFLKYMDAALVTKKLPMPDSIHLYNTYAARAAAISPLFSVKEKLPPTLLINGEDDVTTPAVYAKAFADTLKKYNTEIDIQLLPKTGHAFAVPHYKYSETVAVQAIQAADDFLVKHGFIAGKAIIVDGKDSEWLKRR